VKAAMAAGQSAISVDTKKKELVGDFLTTPLITTPRHYTRPRVRENNGC
jgi:hypothetical protein